MLAKKVNLLYSLLPIGLIATIINSAIITVLLWNLVPRKYLLTWLSAHFIFAFFRIILYTLFKGDVTKDDNVEKWCKSFIFFLMISGLTWGSTAFFGLTHNSIAYQAVVAVVLGGMCAGAAATYSSLRSAYYGFLIPTLLPQIILFFLFATPIHLAVGVMLLLFGILISFSAEANLKIITSNFTLLIKNETLIANLKIANSKFIDEITRRKEVEQQLLESQAGLEMKVKKRTRELSNANEGLKAQVERRMEAEKALRDSEEYFRSIVETAQEGIWVIDENHCISYANERMAQILGYKAEQLRGKDICVFLDKAQRVYHNSDRRVRGIRQKNLRRIDGSLIPVIEAENIMADKSGLHNVKLGMITDITDRQIWEKKIVDLNNRLQESNRELTEFSHSVSHDLRAPLNSIGAFSKLLEEEYFEKIDENGRMYILTIQKAVRRMSNLINDLLTLAKVTRIELHRSRANLTEIVEEILGELQNQQPARKVETKIEKQVHAFCDPGLARIVLENLLNNAWKFTSRKSFTIISFGNLCQERKKVYFVSDNGAGFDMKLSEKLFKPFQRLHSDSEFKGTGIGLATVYRIIKKHGGEIWAESEKDNGATFYFTFESE